MWLKGKMGENCGCHSGMPYRECCFRKERAFLVIGVIAASALFGSYDAGFPVFVPVLLLSAVAGWLVSRHYARQAEQRNK
jgi:membrane protein implicated in regulation of membrane protease activity